MSIFFNCSLRALLFTLILAVSGMLLTSTMFPSSTQLQRLSEPWWSLVKLLSKSKWPQELVIQHFFCFYRIILSLWYLFDIIPLHGPISRSKKSVVNASVPNRQCMQGFHEHFYQEGKFFSQLGKTFWTEFPLKRKFSLEGQTKQAKSSSQPVNLPGTWPLMKPLWMLPFSFEVRIMHQLANRMMKL